MANNVPFTSIVRQISNGEPVDGPTSNKSSVDLTQRTNHLKQLLDSLEAGQLLRVTNVVMESGLVVGTPVYLDSDNVFKKAVQALAEDAVGGAAAKTAYVFGMVLTKETDTSGSIALVGRMTSLAETDWVSVIEGGVFAAGHYFLSGTTAGTITTNPGSLAVYVGQMLEDSTFLLRAAPPVYGAHTHYEFTMVGDPAGTVVDPGVGVDQTIGTPNALARGWLPAEAPYFPVEQIPVGAKFGYNLEYLDDATLKAAFPPIPLTGVEFIQGGIGLDASIVTVNEFGIWWMDNTYGNAPWPVDYAATLEAEEVIIWFSRLLYATDLAVVSHLELDPDSLLDIEILNAADQIASAGRLKLRVSSLLPSASTTDESVTGVKTIAAGVHTSGPVVGRLLPGAGIVMTSPNGNGTDGWYGKVVISASNSDALQGAAALVSLHNARRDEVQDLTMVTLPSGAVASTPVFQIEVSRLAPASNSLRIKPFLYSSASGSTPTVLVQYRIVPVAAVSAALPTGWTTLGTGLTGVTVAAGQVKQVTVSADITSVPAGSIVLVRVVRAASDGFSGNLGIPRLDFELV